MTRQEISVELDRLCSAVKQRMEGLPACLQGDLGEIAYLTDEEKILRHELIQKLMTDFSHEFCPKSAHTRIMERIAARKSAKRLQAGPTATTAGQFFLF